MASVPVFAPVQSRDGSLSRDSYLKNAYVEPFGKDGMRVVRRPGLAVYSTNSAGAGSGITSYRDADSNEYLFVSTGGTLYNASAKAPEADASTKQAVLTSGGNYTYYPELVHKSGVTYAIGSTAANTRFIVWYSLNGGETWTQLLDVVADGTTYPFGFNTCRLCAHNGKIVLVTDGTGGYDTWESADGVTWAKLDDNYGVTTALEALVSHLGALYLFTDDATNPVLKSTDDGATWATAGANPGFEGTSGRLSYGVCSDGTYLYVMGGQSGATNSCQKVYRSADGTTWAELGSNALSGVIASASLGNGVSVAISSGLFYLYENSDSGAAVAKVWTSGDAQTWSLAAQLDYFGYAQNTDIWPTTGGNNYSVRIVIARGRLMMSWFNGTSSFGAAASMRLFSHALTTAQSPLAVGSIGLGKLDFAQDYARTFLVMKSATAAYKSTVPGSVLSAVNDADYPATTVRGLVYLDGYFFVMDPDGTIWNSANEDPTSWSALNYVAASFESDGGVALAKYQNYVVAFGEYTTEFFFDAGNPTGSPLSPAQNGVMNVGCAHGDTVQTIDSQTMWIAQSKSGGQAPATGRFLAKLNGTNYEKLSTPDIDRILDADDFSDVDACTFKVGGHSYYHLRLGASDLSLVFDATAGQWYVWATRRDSFTNTMANVVTSGGTATWTGTHSFADGDRAVVSAFAGTHTALNGTHNVCVPGTNTGTLLWSVGTAYSGTSSGTGTATGYAETDFPVTYSCDFGGQQLLQDKDNGRIYTLDGDVYTDNGVYMDWRARLEKLDGGTNAVKFAAWADLISDRVAGNAMLRVSDDDGQTWTRFRPRSMAGPTTRWHRLGSFRRRLHELRVTDAVPVRAERLELDAVDDETSARKQPQD